ncbi:hypothetical protein TWF694_010370 [Orbilia ellipsospora]|uniref:Survival protein SurE-like phosphatase/nucleotidase domain-containing protein n=1 Tax=Orbilia ellipsospora TaxID=2528407 RepID=A0AAV9X9N9_9PEZI
MTLIHTVEAVIIQHEGLRCGGCAAIAVGSTNTEQREYHDQLFLSKTLRPPNIKNNISTVNDNARETARIMYSQTVLHGQAAWPRLNRSDLHHPHSIRSKQAQALTNDDGPPSPSSPYITSLVRALQAASHTVSVCIPADQKSWIGKAHIIGHHPHPTFYHPDTDTTHPSPRTDGGEEWVLINGTPASCTQIGLFHLFKERGPIDLVLSGPNFGRNSSAVYALSSGTLGGSLEAALSGAKSISVSYAYKSKSNPDEVVDAASAISTRIVDHLYKNWPTDGSVDLYSVNVPLEPGIDHGRILFTHILQNTWSGCYKAVQTSEEEEDAGALEKATRDGTASPPTGANVEEDPKVMDKYKFKWAPRFGDVEKAAKEESAKGSDAWAVMQGFISITPLKANFMHGTGIGEELKL